MAKICTYRSAASCGYLEKNLKPCPQCAFGKDKPAEKAGPPGPKGDKGEKGDRGPIAVGLKGDRGPKGDPGESKLGPPGLTGAPGRDGATIKGDKGERGPKGEKGDTPKIDKEEWLKELEKRLGKYARSNVVLGFGARMTHANLPDVTASQHHTKYTDAEAVAAVSADGAYLLATGARVGSTSEAQSFGSTGVKADVIAESTSGAGVTIDGVLLKDGEVDLEDSKKVKLGTGDDVLLEWDGATFNIAISSGSIKITGGNIAMAADNLGWVLGAGSNALIYYDGTDLQINPRLIGAGDLDISAGNIKLSGANATVDGRDVSVDGTKLDGIATGADVTGDNAPQAHAASHQNAGGDEVNVGGLSGELADNQPPKAHSAASHSAANIIPDANQAYTGDLAVTGAITGTTIGGITQANLVDKSAAETISGKWVFSDYITLSEIAAPAGNPAANTGWLYVKDDAGTSGLYFEADDGVVTDLLAGGGAAQNVALLDGNEHNDTNAAAVSIGSLIVGVTGPAWDELVIGAANSVLWTDGTDPSWTTVPRLAGIKDTGGTQRIDVNAATPHVEINDDFQVEGVMGVKGSSTADARVMLNISPAMTVAATYWYGIQVQPTLTVDNSTRVVRAILGSASVVPNGSYSGLTLHGLYFTSAVSGTSLSPGQTATFTTVAGIYTAVGIVGPINASTFNVSNARGILIEFIITDILGTLAITNSYGVEIGNPHSNKVVNYTGVQIDDETLATGNIYLLEVGDTPNLRVLGGWTAAANQTPVYVSEGNVPTLRQLRTMDPGAGGANFAGGELVCILV